MCVKTPEMDLPVFSELDVQDIVLEVQFTKWTVLNVIPKDQSVARVLCVLARANEANNVSSEQHLAQSYASFEVYTDM